MSIVMLAAIVLAVGFGISAALTAAIIPLLRRQKVEQKILEIGPRWHKSKEGTPTMGGILFPASIALALLLGFLLRGEPPHPLLLPSLLYAVSNGAIGLLDDLQKLRKKQNLGLLPWQKLFLQTLLASVYLYRLGSMKAIDTALSVPFTDFTVEFGVFFWFFALFCMVGIVNCANLTDGIDGLAASVGLIVFLFFAVKGLSINHFSLALLGASAVGAVGGFLLFNFHPAALFMGDTGSLFLGALVVSLCFLAENPILMLLCGIVYVIEGFSVVLQVIWYKLTHRRLFRMAPLHHHFEKRGWREPEIVILFTAATLGAVLLSFLA